MATDDSREKTETELRRLGPAIARALGAGWRSREKHPHFIELIGHNGLLVGLSASYPHANKGRVLVRGCLPLLTRHGQVLLDHGIKNPEITVAVGRGAVAIAGEIKRRLLPGYQTALRQAQARIAIVEEEHDEIERLAKKFSEICGVKVDTDGARFHLPDDLASYGTVTSLGDRVRIEATFTPEQAEDILRALVALARKRTGQR